MLTLSKHILVSFLTAKNLSKNKGIKIFFEIFIIRFFYAFNFIRNLFHFEKKYEKEIFSEKYFVEKINTSQVSKDLNTIGYNNFLKLKDDCLSLIKKEISLKNSIISYKGKKNFENFQACLNEKSNLDIIFSKSLEQGLSHVALDIDLAKTSFIQELATSNFSINILFSFKTF